jgi:hypothetical protein
MEAIQGNAARGALSLRCSAWFEASITGGVCKGTGY